MHCYFLLHSQVPHQGAPRASLVWISHFIAGVMELRVWTTTPESSGFLGSELGSSCLCDTVVHTTHWTHSPDPMPCLLMKGNKSFFPHPMNHQNMFPILPTLLDKLLPQSRIIWNCGLFLCLFVCFGFFMSIWFIHFPVSYWDILNHVLISGELFP